MDSQPATRGTSLGLSALEQALLAEGRRAICGCDEAGRGALAGPVVAAAVILNYDALPPGIDDSKALKREQREALAALIEAGALAFAVALMDAREIERLNILHASLFAMQNAVDQLGLRPDYVLVDGPHLPQMYRVGAAEPQAGGRLPAQAIIDGDAQILCIAAASILAKVARDALMRELHEQYPHYGFAQHKGYATPEHLAALQTHGPCEIHRRSFRPVTELLQGDLFGIVEAAGDDSSAD